MINKEGTLINAWEEESSSLEHKLHSILLSRRPTHGCHSPYNCHHPYPSQRHRLLISRGQHSTSLAATTFDPNFERQHSFISTVDNHKRSVLYDLACHEQALANNNNLLRNSNLSYGTIAKTSGKYCDYHKLGHNACNSNNSSSLLGIRHCYHRHSSIANNNNNTFFNKRYSGKPTIKTQLPPSYTLIGRGRSKHDFNGNTITTREGDEEISLVDDEDVDGKLACINIANYHPTSGTSMEMERFSFGRWKSGVIFQQRTSSGDLMQCYTAPIRRKISYDPGMMKDINDNNRIHYLGSTQSSIDGDTGYSRASFELDIISETGNDAGKNLKMTIRRRSSCHTTIKEVAKTPQVPKKKLSDPSSHHFIANVPLSDIEPASSARSASWAARDSTFSNVTPRIQVSEVRTPETYFPVRKRLRVAVLSVSMMIYSSDDMNLKLLTSNKAYVKLCIMPSKQQKQKGRQVCGKIVSNSDHRHSNFLIFNEEFFFDDISAYDLEMKSLIIKICETYTKGSVSLRLNEPHSSSVDGPCITIANNIKRHFQIFNEYLANRYKDVNIGQICVPFSSISDQLQKKKELNMCKSLQLPALKKAGKIQFSLLLEADDRRLTVNIIRVENLPRYGSSMLP
uniref:C2 domain-containing protein n=1 Tax=Romanomermis culicivorax TaxID=13658 RepID=A0A915IW66_ROMCU